MTALREAAQKALEALEYGQHTLKQVSENQWESRGQLAIEALRVALAEPPVGDSKHAIIAEWWAEKQHKQLTEEEILSLFRISGSPTEFARAIERAHGIKDA